MSRSRFKIVPTVPLTLPVTVVPTVKSTARTSLLVTVRCGYLCFISWGTWWSIPALLLYGNIFYCKIISVHHETNHETYFKSRRLNKLFYEITSFLGGFESVRWKWSHFHHHTYTIFTHKETYDYENNSPRPTEPIRFFLNFFLMIKSGLDF